MGFWLFREDVRDQGAISITFSTCHPAIFFCANIFALLRRRFWGRNMFWGVHVGQSGEMGDTETSNFSLSSLWLRSTSGTARSSCGSCSASQVMFVTFNRLQWIFNLFPINFKSRSFFFNTTWFHPISICKHWIGESGRCAYETKLEGVDFNPPASHLEQLQFFCSKLVDCFRAQRISLVFFCERR